MAHVLVVGAGAIGSHAVPLVARMPGVNQLTVIDPEAYDASNLTGQHIARADVGKSKAQVQARAARLVRADLAVSFIALPVEAVPLGRLRADVILSCVDSRRARLTINQAAWRLGVPWINAGLDASGLVRIQLFVPESGQPCLECAWDPSDYALMEQTYHCAGEAASPRTGSTAALASLAASLLVLECEKWLAGNRDHALVGRDVMVDTQHHRQLVTTFQRNASCRMPDHDVWLIDRVPLDPGSATFMDVFCAFAATEDPATAVTFGVAGCELATTAVCEQCDSERAAVVLVRHGALYDDRCASCLGTVRARGFDLRHEIVGAELGSDLLDRTLSTIGIAIGDVLTVKVGNAIHRVELGGTSWPTLC